MINVLHISSAKNWRGGEQQLAYMVDGLDKKGVKNYILTVSDSDLYKVYSKKNTPCFQQKKSHGLSVQWAKRISQICKENKIDVIHCHDSKAHTYAVLSSVLFNNTAQIVVHRKVIFKIKQSFLTKFKYNHNKVKKIICISKAVQKEVIKILKEDKTCVVYSAKELHQKNENTIDLRANYNLQTSDKIIGYVAALTYEKDHDTFLKVAKKISQKHKNVFFFIIGDGKLKKSIQAKIKKYNLEHKVILTGFLPNAKFLIKQFEVLLFTSQLEGLGTTILDAFEFKTPVVTVKNGGAEEIVFPNKTGWICNKKEVNCLTDKVEKILSNNIDVSIIENAYNYVLQNHNAKKMVDSIYKVYQNVLNNL